MLSLFRSDRESNPAFLKDPAYDALLASAESSKGTESLSHYVAAEKYLNDRCVFYPLTTKAAILPLSPVYPALSSTPTMLGLILFVLEKNKNIG